MGARTCQAIFSMIEAVLPSLSSYTKNLPLPTIYEGNRNVGIRATYIGLYKKKLKKNKYILYPH